MKYPFTLLEKKILVTPCLWKKGNSSAFNFILDTGASKTIIDESVASLLGYNKANTLIESFVTAGGRVNGKLVKLQKLELFGKLVSDFEVSIMKLPLQITLYADGLIGMDFMTKFKNFKIDFEDNTIEV